MSEPTGLRITAIHNAKKGAKDENEEWILISYVLNPLRDFGLIELKKEGEWPGVTEKDEIRVTALWKQFIRFAWSGDAA